MARASHKKARTDCGWRAAAPKTLEQRRRLLARCGKRAFLDPANLKYPVMAKSGPCVIDCRGLRAAKSRAGQYHHRSLEKKATRLGRRVSCHWAP